MSLLNILNPFTGNLQKVVDTAPIEADIATNETNITRNLDNIVLNAFRIAINGSLTQFNMIDGIVDEYEDQSGIDNGASVNEVYQGLGKYYYPDQGITSVYKLLCHFNGADGATSTTDSSPSTHTITFGGDAELDTAIKKWGSASCLFPSTGYLTMPDSTDWDVFENTTDDWTIDFWVYGQFSGTMNFLSQAEDASNYWNIGRENASPLYMIMDTAGATKIRMYYNGAMASNTWHHVAFCKVGANCGLYLNGTQVTFDIHDTPDTFAGILTVASWQGASGSKLVGSMDELRILKTNIFSASPNVGNTDTIVIPTAETPSTPTNMTLISEGFSAEAQPNESRIIVLLEEVDSVTLNTDLIAYVSRDDGATWTQATLTDEGDFDSLKKILVASADISGQPSGTDMRYKLQTANLKNLRIHASAESWG